MKFIAVIKNSAVDGFIVDESQKAFLLSVDPSTSFLPVAGEFDPKKPPMIGDCTVAGDVVTCATSNSP